MNRQTLMKSTLCLLMALVCNVVWAQTQTQATQPLSLTANEFQKAAGKSTWTYHGSTNSGGWYGKFITGTTPALTVESTDTEANNIGWSSNRPWIKAGYTYNLTLPEGYLFDSYKLTTQSTSSGYTNTFTYTTADGTATSESQTVGSNKTITVTGLSTQTITLAPNGDATTSNYGILIVELAITYKKEDDNGVYALEIKGGTGEFTDGFKVWSMYGNIGLTFASNANNMNVNGGYLQIHPGTAGNATYTIAVPTPYVITGYSFDYAFGNSGTATDKVLTVNGQEYTVEATAKTLTVSDLDNVQSTQFTLAGSNQPVKLTNFVVNVVTSVSYTLTDAVGNVYRGTYLGNIGVDEPTFEGAEYTLTDKVWNGNQFTAKIEFTGLPFPLSSAEKVNPTMISSFNEGAGGYGPGRFKWYAAKDDDGDDDVKIKRDALVTEDLIEAYSWAIYPSMENGAFAYSIKNVALDKYIQATKNFGQNAGDNNEGTIILSDTPTKFSVDSNNSLYFFANERNQYLSLGSSGTTDGFLGIHTKTYADGHKGITNAFLTPRYALASKDELKSGGIYTFLTARGWVGATDSDNVIATANTAVTPAASTENKMFQWALYQSKNGNYYLYNLGKEMFMGDVDQSVNEGDIPFAASPMNKNMAFKDNAQAANFPIMFSTNNIHAVSQNTAKGLFAWKGGWNNNDEGSNHQVSYIGELDAEQLKTIADLVEAYDKSMPMKVEVEGSWENNPNTHFGNLTVTTGSAVATTKLTLKNMEVSYVEYTGAGDIFNFTREYRGFEFQGFFLGEENLGKSFTLTEAQEANITEQNPLVAKFTATEAVTLFYDDDEFSYRIPAIATTSTGRIFAVSDYRHNLDDIGRDKHGTGTMRIDLVARYSDNNGETWSEAMTIAAGDNSKTGSYLRAFGDAAIAAVGENIVVMAAAGDQMYPYATVASPNKMARIFSSDNGKTWAISEMTTKMYTGTGLIPDGVAAFFGSGKMVVDANFNGSGKARIYGALLVRRFVNDNYSNYNNYVVYSDDLGETWNILGGSQTPVAGGDEPKAEILPNGQILLSARRGGGRVFNVFTYTDKANNAGTWDTAANGCGNGGSNATNGEIFCVDAKKLDGTAVKLLMQSQPKGGGGQYDRKDVTIWYKEIDANTTYTTATIKDNWIEGLQVSHQQSSYSAVTMQPDGKIALFFEEAPCYADNYEKGYCMVYLPLTIEQITKNKYFSLNADFETERSISVVLTDAQGNEYRDQIESTLPGVADKFTTKYPFITLGDNATLESADGESFTYTNTVTLPFKVSNNETTVWHNIYFPINTNENNYPAYMSAEENSDVVKIVTESAVYGNSTLNTLENAGKISWAIYQSEDDDFAFILKNMSNGQYLKTTSAAPTGSGNENVRYTSSINEAAAFAPSTEGHDQSYQGEYSLKIDNGYVCVWSVGNGYVTYSQNKSHKGAWVKFVEAPDFETLFAEVNAVLNMFGDGLGQYSKISDENLAAVTAAKTAMQAPGSVKLNTLNEYKNYTSKTAGGTLNLPKDGQYFRVAYDYGGNAGKLYMQSTASSVKGLEFTAATDAASIWVYYDGALYSYTAGQCLRETGDDRGLQAVGGKTTATFSASTRAKGKYNLLCGSYVHANTSNGKYYTDHCSGNNCAQHDLILEEVTELPVTISRVGYATFIAPVALAIPDSVKAYTGNVNGEWLTLAEIEGGVIPANTGVVLESQFKEGEEKFAKNFSFTITEDVTPIASDLVGSTAAKANEYSGEEDVNTHIPYYTLQQELDENKQPTGNLVFMQYNGNVLAGSKAYLVLPEGQKSIGVRFEDGTTDIEHSTLNPEPSTQIYDLMGRRVEAMTKGGIYIVNGKKVIK